MLMMMMTLMMIIMMMMIDVDDDDDDMYDTDNKAGDDAIHLGFSYHTHLSLKPP